MNNTNDVPRDLLDFLRAGKKFIIAGHKESDGDCVGSQLALCSVLRRMGKEAIPCSPGPLKRSEVIAYTGFFKTSVDEETKKDAWVIITDCTGLDRTGDLAPMLEGLPAALIDHHQHGKEMPEHKSGPVYISAAAPSVTFMILKIIDALGLEPSREEAEFLLFGLCTDTGFFRHSNLGSAPTFETAARLVSAGASPRKTHQTIHGGKSLESRYLIGILLSRAKPYFDGKLIVTTEEYEDTQRFGEKNRDSDILYQMLLSVAGVEAIAVIRQETPENCTISLRSMNDVDVALIARTLGGGGHKNAAGAGIPGVIADIKAKLLELFRLQLS